MNKTAIPYIPDKILSFDVGHSSIGWAVLQARSTQDSPNILGTGAVTFPADDCLASKRRMYRRQRRHVRSTRQRMERMEKLLVHIGALSAEEVEAKHAQGKGHPRPWLLAARLLASDGAESHLLSWNELWDVLRWYAHNRGYDGNRRWAGDIGIASDTEDDDDDTEKVEKAKSLMATHGTKTMAETITTLMWKGKAGRNVFDVLKAADEEFIPKNHRYKAENAAFPRDTVEKEVRRILEHHRTHLPQLTDAFISLLLDQTDDRALLKAAGVLLPKRFHGGLLFGQFIPRFDNRIITTCPVSGEKVPAKTSREFLLYRWLMQLVNVRVVREGEGSSSLSKEERLQVHEEMLAKGFFTAGQFKEAIRKTTHTKADNLDTMLMHPDADKALVLDPVKKLIASERVQYLWPHLPERVKKRAVGKWVKGKFFPLQTLLEWSAELETPAEEILAAARAAQPKKGKKTDEAALLVAVPKTENLSGRAPFHRDILTKASHEVLAGFDPRKKSKINDPENGEDKPDDGVLVRDHLTTAAPTPFPDFEKWQRRWAKRPGNAGKPLSEAKHLYEEARAKSLHDSRTNNHLVRHRLLILQRLVEDIIADPTLLNGDRDSVKSVAIEVNSELKALSGKTAKQVAQDIGLRMGNFKSVVKKLEEAGIPHPNAGLIRKARVAEDLNWTCPYTGKRFDPQDLRNPNVWDKDHIIPYSQRPSNSLDSLVITKKSLNNLKTNRTGLEFIEWINQPENHVLRDQHGVWTVKQFKDFVNGLETWKGHDDDKKRKRRRKQLLLLPKWEEKEGGFLPRDLTVTSQLVRLGALSLQHSLPNLPNHHITSIPGKVTGTIRTGWNLLGTIQSANPGVIDKETGNLKTKTEIREVSHLHHAVDAVVLGLTNHFFPKNGRLWEAMVRREKQRTPEDNQLLINTGLYVPSQENGKPVVLFNRSLPPEIEEQLRERLSERRVVQHLPADMSGMAVEENTRGVVNIHEDGTVSLKQVSRDLKTGKPVTKFTKESPSKLIGLKSGKLKDQKGVRVITANYGVAILDAAPPKEDGSPGDEEDRFVVIPFAGVWRKIKELILMNKGKSPLILRNGMRIHISDGTYKGIWTIFSVKNNASGLALDIGWPDVVRLQNKTPGHKINVNLMTLVKNGLSEIEDNYSAQS